MIKIKNQKSKKKGKGEGGKGPCKCQETQLMQSAWAKCTNGRGILLAWVPYLRSKLETGRWATDSWSVAYNELLSIKRRESECKNRSKSRYRTVLKLKIIAGAITSDRSKSAVVLNILDENELKIAAEKVESQWRGRCWRGCSTARRCQVPKKTAWTTQMA